MASQAAAAKATAPEAVDAHVHVVCARARARRGQRRGLCLRVLRRYQDILYGFFPSHCCTCCEGRCTCLSCIKTWVAFFGKARTLASAVGTPHARMRARHA